MSQRNDLKWFNYMIPDPKRATDEQIEEVEIALGVRLPADYVAVAREHQGQLVEPSNINMPDGGTGFGFLLHFELGEEYRRYSIVGYPASPGLYDALPDAVPICFDGGGNYFAFDYGRDKKTPPIVFWDHETGGVHVVAKTFTELLELLNDDF